MISKKEMGGKAFTNHRGFLKLKVPKKAQCTVANPPNVTKNHGNWPDLAAEMVFRRNKFSRSFPPMKGRQGAVSGSYLMDGGWFTILLAITKQDEIRWRITGMRWELILGWYGSGNFTDQVCNKNLDVRQRDAKQQDRERMGWDLANKHGTLPCSGRVNCD